MKIAFVALAALLAGILGWSLGEMTSAQVGEVGSSHVRDDSGSTEGEQAPGADPENEAIGMEPVAWSSLFASSDLRPLTLALRQAGFSGRSIRSYLEHAINQRQEKAWLDIMHPESARWWETINHRKQDMGRVLRLQTEARQIVDDLMFDQPESDLEKRERLATWGRISREKVKAVQRIKSESQLQMVEASASDEAGANRYQEIEAAEVETIRSLLSEAEFRDYVARYSDESGRLRSRTRFLDLTEEQFTTAVWADHNFQMVAKRVDTRSESERYGIAKAGILAQREIWRAFGDELYYEFTRSDAGREPPGSHTGLIPPERILSGMEVSFRLTELLADIHSNYSADNPLQFSLLSEAYDQHVAEVRQSMTPAEFEAYLKSDDGRWIERMRPRPPG